MSAGRLPLDKLGVFDGQSLAAARTVYRSAVKLVRRRDDWISSCGAAVGSEMTQSRAGGRQDRRAWRRVRGGCTGAGTWMRAWRNCSNVGRRP